MSRKKKSGPKSQHMENLNRKAFLSVNRAGALEQAYMELSGAVIEMVRRVETKEVVPEEAVLELAAKWQYIDGMLLLQFQKISGAVQPLRQVLKQAAESARMPSTPPVIADEVQDVAQAEL